MNYHPLPYQTVGTNWLIDHPRAALFAECGLGKTAMTLDALRHLFADGDCIGALIVAPLRVATLQWPNEVRQWEEFRWMRIADLRTSAGWKMLLDGSAHLYITNYEQLPKLAQDYCYNRRTFAFDTVVFDELSRAKSHKSTRIKALKPYLPKLKRRIGLTGTPVANGYLDLWAQITLLDDGALLGRTFQHYRNNFFDSDYMGYKWTMKDGAKDVIDRKTSEIALTLRASDYLDIPDTRTEDIEVTLPKDARTTYDIFERELVAMLKDGTAVTAPSAGVLVNKLLQVASGTLYDEERNVHELHYAKLDALETLRGEPLLVATNYIHERKRILARFPSAREWSDDLLEPWNAGKIEMLVADPRSIGHGLNLMHGGRTVVWFSPTWSRESYDQFNARLARKGQKRQPLVYRITAADTVDEAVMEALRQKGDTQTGLMRALTALQAMRA